MLQWLFEESPPEIKAGLVNHSLLGIAFAKLQNPVMTEDCVDTLEEVLDMCSNPKEYEALYQFYLQKILSSIQL